MTRPTVMLGWALLALAVLLLAADAADQLIATYGTLGGLAWTVAGLGIGAGLMWLAHLGSRERRP